MKGQELEMIHQKSARSLRIAKVDLNFCGFTPLSIDNEDIGVRGLFQLLSELSEDFVLLGRGRRQDKGFVHDRMYLEEGIHTVTYKHVHMHIDPDLIKRVKDPIYV